MREGMDRKDAVESMVKDAMEKDIPPEVEARLRGQLSEFRVRLAGRTRRGSAPRRMAHAAYRLGWAATLLLLVLGGAGYFFGSRTTPTWADVMERFASVSSLHATIYVRENVLAEPVQLELWMGHGGKLRLHAGNKVAFGDNGRVLEEVPIGSPANVSRGLRAAEQTVQYFINKLGRVDTFSFETLLRLLPELRTMSAPLHNQEATISKDLVVFDMTGENSPEWVRIWTLRESRLPVRVLFWDPRSAQTTDVLLSYGNPQLPEFFDPEAFKAILAAGGGPPDRAYALLKDVAGRPITPSDVAAFEKAREEEALESDAERRGAGANSRT